MKNANLPLPDYENPHVARRRIIGEWADQLVSEIKKQAGTPQPLTQAEVEEMIQGLEQLKTIEGPEAEL